MIKGLRRPSVDMQVPKSHPGYKLAITLRSQQHFDSQMANLAREAQSHFRNLRREEAVFDR